MRRLPGARRKLVPEEDRCVMNHWKLNDTSEWTKWGDGCRALRPRKPLSPLGSAFQALLPRFYQPYHCFLRMPTPFLHPPHLSLAHTPDLEKAVICGPKLQIHTFNTSLTPPTCRSNRYLKLLKLLLLPDPSPRYLIQTV